MVGFWETVLITFFGLAFHMANDPYGCRNPHSRAYVGVGAFQMMRRAAYEAAGTHRRLAMEVVDDMKLGKLVKQAGFRSGVGVARDSVVMRWHAGCWEFDSRSDQEFLCGAGVFSLRLVGLSICGTLLLNVLPFVALPFVHGWVLACRGGGGGDCAAFHVGVDVVMRVSPLYALTFPLGAR